MTTPAGTFSDACVVRSTLRYAQTNLDVVLEGWFVPTIGLVKSKDISRTGSANGASIGNTSETILVSIQ